MAYLVTTALTYANGPLHLGHWLEAIYADIWVRAMRMAGHEVRFLSGDDAHGTPIMLKANSLGITPDQLVADIHAERRDLLKRALIDYDNYHTTHDEHTRQMTETFYRRFQDKNLFETKMITQAYDEQAKMFLPDRFVKGTCPRCKAPDQYGDSCEACGATYDTEELIDPRSTLSGKPPSKRETEHLFFNLEKCRPMLQDWLAKGTCQPAVANKLTEWFGEELRPWDVTRDAPYFGFPIPDRPDQYFYVWLDAPIGYMGSHKAYCEKHGCPDEFDRFWGPDSDAEIIHFIGKDIIYFHGLFWPAMLHHAGYKTPSRLNVHGFLTINGEKMSKSRGTFITVETLLKHLPAEYMRYYLAGKFNGQVEDMDLNWEDFTNKINADLVGKVVNIASRCCKLLEKHFDNHLATGLDAAGLIDSILSAREEIAGDYEAGCISRVVRRVMALSDDVNQYINDQAPWHAIKESDDKEQVQRVLTTAINAFQLLVRYLTPILPEMGKRVAEQLCCGDRWTWDNMDTLLLGQTIRPYEHLCTRVKPEHIPHEG